MAQEINENKKEISQDLELKIMPDTSWLIALVDEKDSHHVPVKSSFGAIFPYNPTFYIPAVVYLETLSKLVRANKISPKKAYDKIQKVLEKINFKHSTKLGMDDIINKYKAFSRIKISKLTALDFYIVAEGISLEAKILTCDVHMYSIAKKYYNKIYFLTDKVKDYESELANLIRDVQKEKTL